jgi:thiosulfate/3-mercaptopyruvate sulfurtransferase
MAYTTLIDTATLASHLDDPRWAVVDCRFVLADPGRGSLDYLEGHIPGAVYAHLEDDLSGERSGRNGRHPLPDPGALASVLSRLGIGPGVQVVVYDQDTGSFASRLWWLLRWMGHDAVAVLDGGFAGWTAEQRPTRSGAETRTPASFAGQPHPDMVADLDEVARVSASAPSRLLDARAPERYRGDIEPIDRVPGHIPGAINDHFMQNVDERGRFRPAGALRQRLAPLVAGRKPEEMIGYCGSGVTACHNLLAFEVAGVRGVRLYPGSWSEWSSDPARPVERSSPPDKEKGPAA